MTIHATDSTSGTFDLVAVDLYRDIHKGIRSALFAVTAAAGQTDPSDREARGDLAAHVRDVHWLLESHAEHEDTMVQPLVEEHLPEVAEQIAADHLSFDARTASLVALAGETAEATESDRRRLTHLLYLELAAFTGVYLAHQDVEERVLMPGLEKAIGVDATLAVHQQIVGSIPPEVMARSLAIMLPSMNLDDRTELLGGMQAGAPPEAFAAVWDLTGSVLATPDRAALAARLGIS